jgi:integrase/recombinase XerD
MEEIVISGSGETLLSAEAFKRLAEVPAEIEWFADIQNPNIRDSYQRDVGQFMAFLGIDRADQCREVGRAHVIAWRKTLVAQKLSPATIRRKLSAVSSLCRPRLTRSLLLPATKFTTGSSFAG